MRRTTAKALTVVSLISPTVAALPHDATRVIPAQQQAAMLPPSPDLADGHERDPRPVNYPRTERPAYTLVLPWTGDSLAAFTWTTVS